MLAVCLVSCGNSRPGFSPTTSHVLRAGFRSLAGIGSSAMPGLGDGKASSSIPTT